MKLNSPTLAPRNMGGMFVCHPRALNLTASARQGLTLLSDIHLGAPQCDLPLLQKHLRQAARKQDRLLINGDLLDCILVKDPKRYKPHALHRRLHGVGDILGTVIDWAVELLGPYANLIDLVATGNHEESCTSQHSLDPISQVVKRLQEKVTAPGHRIHYGGYTGFIRYPLVAPSVLSHGSNFTIFYWHGAGPAGGPGGALQEFAVRGAFVEGVDLVWYAHRHLRVVSQIEKVSCPVRGSEPVCRPQWLVRTGAYLRTFGGQTQDHWARKGRQGNYGADALHAPYGRGGLRVVLSAAHPLGRIEVV